MLPTPRDGNEAGLWQAHIRLDAARAEGRDMSGASEAARKLVADLAHGSATQVDALAAFLRRLDTEVGGLEQELERVRLLLDRAKDDRRRFRAFTRAAIEEWGQDAVRGNASRLGLQRGRDELVIDNETLLAAPYRTVEPERFVIHERELTDALRSGAVVVGAHLTPGPRTLVVR